MADDARAPTEKSLHDLRALTARFATVGRVAAVVLRPGRGQPAHSVPGARALAGLGLQGDRSAAGAPGGKRQITLVQAEHLALIGAWAGIAPPRPEQLRRNLVIEGLNLAAARSPFADRPLRLAIGETVELELSGPCDPCSKMEAALGAGAYNAMRGHGGMTARVLHGGWLQLGDPVRVRPAT